LLAEIQVIAANAEKSSRRCILKAFSQPKIAQSPKSKEQYRLFLLGVSARSEQRECGLSRIWTKLTGKRLRDFPVQRFSM
jgi:hypothetical protein